MSKSVLPWKDKPTIKVDRLDEFTGPIGLRDFLRIGLILNGIVLMILAPVVVVSLWCDPDFICVALFVLAYFSFGVWVGTSLVAIPTQLVVTIWRFLVHRASKSHARASRLWDHPIDGPIVR